MRLVGRLGVLLGVGDERLGTHSYKQHTRPTLMYRASKEIDTFEINYLNIRELEKYYLRQTLKICCEMPSTLQFGDINVDLSLQPNLVSLWTMRKARSHNIKTSS